MKMQMVIWAYIADHNTSKIPPWFKHGEAADISWEQIQEIYNSGLFVMLKNSGSLERPTRKSKASVLIEDADSIGMLAIDDRPFRQR